jgi:hypothetical protein
MMAIFTESLVTKEYTLIKVLSTMCRSKLIYSANIYIKMYSFVTALSLKMAIMGRNM